MAKGKHRRKYGITEVKIQPATEGSHPYIEKHHGRISSLLYMYAEHHRA